MSVKHKRTVEIYFVLYLAAILFLLPDKEPDIGELQTNGFPVVSSEFSIQPVKTTLSCNFSNDSLGLRILSIDSVNTILYTGNVEDVKFEFELIDQSLRQRQKIQSNSKYFRFEENLKQNELKFFWEPPLLEKKNKTYIIKVRATAKEINRNQTGNFAAGGSRWLKDETQFSLNLTYINKDFAVNKSLEENSLAENNALSFDNERLQELLNSQRAEINIDIEKPVVSALAYRKWTNKIYIFNANLKNDLKGKPEINVILEPKNNKGTARVYEITENLIKLIGNTPSHGNMKVEVTTKFNHDNKIRTTPFSVKPISIEKPKYNTTMYPEKAYIIKPNLPIISGQEAKAYIKYGSEIIRKSEQGESINFRPELSHIGKTLKFVRLIDGNILDSYEIRVLNYPEPIIYDMQLDNDGVLKVITRSYGFFNGELNEVRLIAEGNVSIRELRGKNYPAPDDITIIQIFRCIPKFKDKSFVFKIRAVDKRGRKSAQKNYKEN